jgi:hypothetical protein
MHPQPCFRMRDPDQVLCRVAKSDSDDHELRRSRAYHGRCDLVFGSRLRRILLWGIALHTDTDCWFSRVNEAKEFGIAVVDIIDDQFMAARGSTVDTIYDGPTSWKTRQQLHQ